MSEQSDHVLVLGAGSYSPGGANVPTATITDTNVQSPLQSQSLDVDANGHNLYFGYVGLICNPSCTNYYGGVDDITSPRSNTPTFTTLISQTVGQPIEFTGGIQVTTSAGNSYVNIEDQGYSFSGNNALYRFALPWTGVPISTIKSPQNKFNGCDPIFFGYNKKATSVAVADYSCHALMIGDVAHDGWKTRFNIDFVHPIGAAYDPSNK